MRIKVLLHILFLLIVSDSIQSQVHLKSAIDSLPVTDANICIEGQSKHYSSDNFGYVRIAGFTQSLAVSISHPGFDNLNTIIKPGMVIYMKVKVHEYGNFVFTGISGQKKSIKDELASVKIINAQDISRSGAQNLGDILKYEPNITLNNDPSLGTSVSINGMSGQNVKLLKNGAGISGAMNGNIDVSQLNISAVEQVEIIEGPMSLLYGSNALAGTINIISKTPNSKRSIGVKTYTESSGIYNLSVSYGNRFKKLSYTLNGGRNFFDGWNPGNSFFYYPMNDIANAERNTLWKPRRQVYGDMSILYPLGKRAQLKLNHDFLSETIINRGLPQIPYNESAFDDYYLTRRLTNSGELNLNYGNIKHNILASCNFFSRTKNTFLKDLTSTDKGSITGAENQDSTKILSSQLRFITTVRIRKLKLNGGIDINHETFTGKRVLNDRQSISNASLVAIASYPLKKNSELKIGFRQTLHSRNTIPLLPSFLLRIGIDKYSDLKLSAGKGYRTPGIKELYLYFVDINHNIVGNPELKSESSQNFSVLINRKRKINKNFSWNAQLNGYYNSFKNLITLAAVNLTEYTYANIGEASNHGLNSQIGFEYKRLELSYRNAILSSSNNVDESNIPEFFTGINHSVLGNYMFNKKRAFRYNLYVNYFGKTPSLTVINSTTALTYTEAYCLIDMSVSLPFTYKSSKFNFTAGLRNLNNVSNVNTGISNGLAHQSSGGQRIISTGKTIFISLDYTL